MEATRWSVRPPAARGGVERLDLGAARDLATAGRTVAGTPGALS